MRMICRHWTAALWAALLLSMSSPTSAYSSSPLRREIPDKVLIGYASRCGDGSVRRAVANGVNVVIWAFANFVSNHEKQADDNDVSSQSALFRRRTSSSATPTIQTTLDLLCIHQDIQILDAEGYDDVVHLISFGGWNGGQLDPQYSVEDLYTSFKEFGGDIFHGIDWDFEGDDTAVDSPNNTFSVDVLDRMGEFSQLAKQDGYIVTLAPPQSYLDVSTIRFSRHVNLTTFDLEWHPEFTYMGRNVYAYLLAKYGNSIDLVSVQWYESYSRAAYSINHVGVRPAVYLESYVTDLALRGGKFWVEFEQDPQVNLKSQLVSLPLNKLVIGLANGWAKNPQGNDDKTLFIDPTDIQAGYEALTESPGFLPRGFMFWTIDEEGRNGVEMAAGLNKVLHIRPDDDDKHLRTTAIV